MTTFVRSPEPGFIVGGVLHPGGEAVKPKRYLVFSGDNYYPSGGWQDFRGSADTAADAFDAARAESDDWYSVIDMETGQEIADDRVGSGRK